MNGYYFRIVFYNGKNGIIYGDGFFFGNFSLAGIKILNADMAGKSIHFFPDGIFKPLCKSDRENHSHDADGRGRDGETDDKPGKGMLTVKCDSPGNETGKIQSGNFNTQK